MIRLISYNQKPQTLTSEAKGQRNTCSIHIGQPLHSLLARLADVRDVGEEMVVFRLGHGIAELRGVLEHANQDLQTVQIRVL